MLVNIRLNLPKVSNKLTIRYNTFEKVSYDRYFVASLLSETRDKRKAEKLIDELTGKGSLNFHFKKLYEEVKELTKDQIESILKDSLYPIQKIEEHRYLLIPLLNLSIYNRQVIIGNLSDNKLFPQSIVPEGGTYLTHSYDFGEPKVKPDMYTVDLSDETIEIQVNDKFYQINQSDFQSIVTREDFDLNNYQGTIYNSIKGSGWNQLTKSTINNILDTKDFYYEQGDHFGIYNDNVKRTSIAYAWGIYWFKEIIYKYQSSTNRDIFERAARVLMHTGRINEIKTKTLLDILRNTNRDLQQEIINYVLSKKDVKELALNGLFLIDKGYEKGWNEHAVNSFYKFYETSNQLLLIYKVNNNLEFKIDEILNINRLDLTILTEKHKNDLDSYNKDIEQITLNINQKLGELMSSGIRENVGKMPIDENSRKLRKFLNDIAHYKKDIKNKNLNELKQYEETVNKNYDIYLIVKKRWENYNK